MVINGLGNSALDTSNGIIKEGKGGSELGRDDFLMLLLEQIKNQDPLSPMENTEFTAQLAQFSSLSEMRTVNETLETMLFSQMSMNNATVVNLIGKNVEVQGNEVQMTDENADIRYKLPQAAMNVSIDIFNANEVLVATLSGTPKEKDTHTVKWDGKDKDGNQLPDGKYLFEVKAKDVNGEEIDAIELIRGEVSELTFEENGTYLHVNGKKVAMSDVSRISED